MLSELTQEIVHIPGPRGTLVGELTYGEPPAVGMVLLANPHPHMGGTKDNFLIASLAGDLARMGWVTLRFDYSGVNDSDGPRIDVAESVATFWATGNAPEDPCLIDDVRSVITWLHSEFDLPLAMIGYSFGSYAAVCAMPDDLTAMILISPTINQHDFSRLLDCAVPKMVIYSDNDFATPVEAARRWIEILSNPKQQLCISGGEHFYRSRERDVTAACEGFITEAVQNPEKQQS